MTVNNTRKNTTNKLIKGLIGSVWGEGGHLVPNGNQMGTKRETNGNQIGTKWEPNGNDRRVEHSALLNKLTYAECLNSN